MENIILNMHRGFAYLILVAAAVFLIALFMAMFGYSGKINKFLKKSTLFTMVLFHIQFLVGLGMLFIQSGFLQIIKENGMGFIMKDATLRFNYIEHPFSMLVAAVLMTIVNRKVKSNETLTTGIMMMAIVSIALMLYAFPFARLFNL